MITLTEAIAEKDRACQVLVAYWDEGKISELVAAAERSGMLYVVDSLRDAIRAQGIPREWALYECGHCYARIEATSAKEAVRQAVANVDPNNYPDGPGKIAVDVRVTCALTDEEEEATVRVTLIGVDPDM